MRILQGKCRTSIPGQTFFVEMHMDMSQAAFCAEIYSENTVRLSLGKHFLRACAVEMHMDTSQAAFCAEIYKCRTRIPRQAFCASLRSRNAHGHVNKRHFVRKFTGKMLYATATTSIEHRALTLSTITYRKNPFSVATLFGEKHV